MANSQRIQADRPSATSAPRSAFARGRRAPGFTLIELVAVVTVLGVLAATAIPALTSLGASRDAGLAHEVARRLHAARAFAIGVERPAGVRISLNSTTISSVWMPTDVDPPAPAPDALGQASGSVALASIFGGGSIVSFVNGDGRTSLTTIWFGADGSPHLRTTTGAYIGPFTQDAVITFGGGHTAIVRRATGAVEP